MKKKVLDIDIISFVSHELKSPLSTLKLNADMLLKQTSGENKKQVQMMCQEIDWIIQFISNTLDLKGIENYPILNFCWHNRVNWLSAIKSEIEQKTQLANKKLKLYNLADKNILLHIDSVYMKQALMNLVINAIEHSPKNSLIELFFTLKKGKKFLQVQVKNQGLGLKPKDMDKIFEPFYSKKQGITKGTGLGLPISKKIIEAHGGSIYAQNCLNKKGTVFTFTVPYYLNKNKTVS